jgi:hypothetical protein
MIESVVHHGIKVERNRLAEGHGGLGVHHHRMPLNVDRPIEGTRLTSAATVSGTGVQEGASFAVIARIGYADQFRNNLLPAQPGARVTHSYVAVVIQVGAVNRHAGYADEQLRVTCLHSVAGIAVIAPHIGYALHTVAQQFMTHAILATGFFPANLAFARRKGILAAIPDEHIELAPFPAVAQEPVVAKRVINDQQAHPGRKTGVVVAIAAVGAVRRRFTLDTCV